MKWSSLEDPKKVGGWPCQSLGHDAGWVRPWVPHGRLSTLGAQQPVCPPVQSHAERAGRAQGSMPRLEQHAFQKQFAVPLHIRLVQPQGQGGRGAAVVRGVHAPQQRCASGAAPGTRRRAGGKPGKNGRWTTCEKGDPFAVLPIMVIFQLTNPLGS